jgi:uracil-DNA glycosylase
MTTVGTFPFGQPIHRVVQEDRSKKRVFVLGVYASAVHARWVGPDGAPHVKALAVHSEPGMFWDGAGAEEIIAKISIPSIAGHLEAAEESFNGATGKAVDAMYLAPLGLAREDVWFCDLVPHSCINERQRKALRRKYDPIADALGLPPYDWPELPFYLTNEQRCEEILGELVESGADTIITLGDQPLKHFTLYHGSEESLASFAAAGMEYGRAQPLRIGGRELRLLPLVHPKVAARLGAYSAEWAARHAEWTQNPPNLG